MQASVLAAGITFSAGDNIVVIVVAAVAVIALAIGFVLRRQVLAADEGTQGMRDIGKAKPL